MKSNFTFNDLIHFAFNDTLEKFDPEGSETMETDDEIKELCEIGLHDDQNVGPDSKIINNIMSYSRALNVITTKHSGVFNLLMN